MLHKMLRTLRYGRYNLSLWTPCTPTTREFSETTISVNLTYIAIASHVLAKMSLLDFAVRAPFQNGTFLTLNTLMQLVNQIIINFIFEKWLLK